MYNRTIFISYFHIHSADAIDWTVLDGLIVAAADRRPTRISCQFEEYANFRREQFHCENNQVGGQHEETSGTVWTQHGTHFSSISFRLSTGDKPFEAKITIPRLTIQARYTSSGVLLIIPASGAGDFDAVLDGVIAEVKGQTSSTQKGGNTYLHVDSLVMDLNVKKVRMHIARVFKNNRILSKFPSKWMLTLKRLSLIINYTLHFTAEATNLFLKENGLEVLRAMQPQLQKKLAVEFAGIANQLLEYVPVESFIVG